MSFKDHVIPAITDGLGKYWDQPDRKDVIDCGDHFEVGRAAFDLLKDYSCSYPSGVYDGKMWKAQRCGQWFLRWYDPHEDPKKCTIGEKRLVLV